MDDISDDSVIIMDVGFDDGKLKFLLNLKNK